MTERGLEVLADERAIRDVLYRYCRGVDRMDLALTRSCWHANGSADYRGMFSGDADALLDWMWKLHARLETHSHQITNLLVEVAGERAASEAYVTVALRAPASSASLRGSGRDILARGRYVDRWSRRGGRWAIDHRIYLNDWMTYLPVPAEPTPPSGGRRDRDDASYAAFAELRGGC
jgi:hypothetical protein